MSGIQYYLIAGTQFIGNVLIPLLFAVALLVFVVNAARFFVIGGHQDESREKAKQLALYAVLALVFLVSIWGIVNLFVNAFGFDSSWPVDSDYKEIYGG